LQILLAILYVTTIHSNTVDQTRVFSWKCRWLWKEPGWL